MDHQQPAQIRLATLGDVLAVVPYLLGFHPTDSLVIVGLTGTQLTVASRADLPQPDDLDRWVDTALPQHLTLLHNVDASTAALIGYGPAQAVTPVVDRFAPRLREGGVTVVDTVRVTDGRYHSYHCHDPRCCPADGVPFDAHYSRTAVQAIIAGQTALPDRAALIASVASTAGAVTAAASLRAQDRAFRVMTAGGRAALIRAGKKAVTDAVARYAADDVLSDDEMAWLCVVLADSAVRDFAGQATGSQPWHLALWTDLTRRADPGYAAAPASLLALTAWRRGYGALASVACDRALTADPHYRLAHLIDHALRHGIPPTALDDPPSDGDPTP